MLINGIKTIIEQIPYPLGAIISKIPFRLRLGKTYSVYKELASNFDEWSHTEKNDYIIQNFRNIFNYAKDNFPFYKTLYKEAGISNLQITNLSDIKKIPVITKEMIRSHTKEFSGSMLINTGGTSGEPFAFYIDKHAFAREWGHMHRIWALKNYDPKDLKITLRGKNLGKENIRYNPVHNEFIVNTYKNTANFKNELLSLFSKYKIKYVHGYPSAVYNFFKELEPIISQNQKEIVTSNIKACFLGSEFPMPLFTNYLTDVWKLDYISWYGHSEMCILAYDEEKANKYVPFYTYGFTEVVDNHLIGTSYHNYDMPLIRYDTGDIVEGSFSDSSGLLSHFKITDGREGEFIIDKKGKRIPLTALIFGRHHKAFEYFDFVQVEQKIPGKATFYLCKKNWSLNSLSSSDFLNLTNVDIDAEIKIVEEPTRTRAGKVKLLI